MKTKGAATRNWVKVVSKDKRKCSQKAAKTLNIVLNYYVNQDRELFKALVKEAYEKGTKANLDLLGSSR